MNFYIGITALIIGLGMGGMLLFDIYMECRGYRRFRKELKELKAENKHLMADCCNQAALIWELKGKKEEIK